METIHLVIIALIFYLLLSNKEEYENVVMETSSYSSPLSSIDWLNVSDLDYGKLITTLQGKKDAVRIRNLV